MSAYISDCQNYYEVIAGATNNAYLSPEEACDNCDGSSKKFSPDLGWGNGGACSSAPNVAISSLPNPPVFISDGRRVFATANKASAINNGYDSHETPCEACRKCKRETNSDPDSFLWTEVGTCDNIDDIELPSEYDSDGKNWYYNFNSMATSASSPLDACHNASSASPNPGRLEGSCNAVLQENFTFSGSSTTNWMLIAGIILVVAVIAALVWYTKAHKSTNPKGGESAEFLFF